MVMIRAVEVAKADGCWKDDGNVGEDRTQAVRVGGLEHQIMRELVDQHEQRVVDEGADAPGRQHYAPPRRSDDGEGDGDRHLQRDQGARPCEALGIAAEQGAQLVRPEPRSPVSGAEGDGAVSSNPRHVKSSLFIGSFV